MDASTAQPIANTQLTTMFSDDISAAVTVIESHDEDDAQEAQHSFERGLEGLFVYQLNNEIIGVCGYKAMPDCIDTYYLSWTYIQKEQCGKGYGRDMLEQVLEKLKSINARKVFIKTSDYVDEDDGPIYEAAFQLYQKLGFALEVTLNDYYDDGENLRILGKRLKDKDLELGVENIEPAMIFDSIYRIAETESCFSFGWSVVPGKKGLFGKVKPAKGFTKNDIMIGLDSVKAEGATSAVLSFPSNFDYIGERLVDTGFEYVSQLEDYYDDNIHELHFQHRF